MNLNSYQMSFFKDYKILASLFNKNQNDSYKITFNLVNIDRTNSEDTINKMKSILKDNKYIYRIILNYDYERNEYVSFNLKLIKNIKIADYEVHGQHQEYSYLNKCDENISYIYNLTLNDDEIYEYNDIELSESLCTDGVNYYLINSSFIFNHEGTYQKEFIKLLNELFSPFNLNF